MRIAWSDQSLEDIEEIRRYIQRDSHVYAELFVDRVFEAAERLIEYPLSGRVVPEFDDPTLREIILGSDRIVHRVRQGTISIVTVFHTARLLKPEHVRESP
jgi:plasmid stabilization system protein ParE